MEKQGIFDLVPTTSHLVCPPHEILFKSITRRTTRMGAFIKGYPLPTSKEIFGESRLTQPIAPVLQQYTA